MKNIFIHDECWSSTIGGAFQRANVYQKGANEKDKKAFKKALREKVESYTLEYERGTIAEAKHIENIKSIGVFTKKYHELLSNGGFNFGVSQKLFNLHLKYRWCLGEIHEPPHFPVDRIIQKLLKYPNLTAWTKMKDETPYRAIIEHAKTKCKADESLAELELRIFQRRSIS